MPEVCYFLPQGFCCLFVVAFKTSIYITALKQQQLSLYESVYIPVNKQ